MLFHRVFIISGDRTAQGPRGWGSRVRGSQEGHSMGRRQGRARLGPEELPLCSPPCSRLLASASPCCSRAHTGPHAGPHAAGRPASAAPLAQMLPSILLRGLKSQFSQGVGSPVPLPLTAPGGVRTRDLATRLHRPEARLGTMYPPCVYGKGPASVDVARGQVSAAP